MKTIDEKLEEITLEEIVEFCKRERKKPYPLNSGTIKKTYNKWLKEDKDERTWKEVISKKINDHLARVEHQKKSFVPQQIGYVEFIEEFGYIIHMQGRMPLKVTFQEPTKKKRDKSLKRFIKDNNLQVKNAKDRDDVQVIYTDLDLRRFS